MVNSFLSRIGTFNESAAAVNSSLGMEKPLVDPRLDFLIFS